MYLGVIFLCLCISVGVYGSPNSLKDPYICGAPSCAPSEKFKYLSDVIYYYEYKVNVETYFAGSSNNRSTLDIRAVTKIQFISPCEGLLHLSDVTLIDQDESYPVERAEKFIHALSLHDLRFAFHDGAISEICPEDEEEDWVLNFKRAILALFQNTMKRFDIHFKGVEQDVHGTCNVDYAVRGQENTSLILIKTRDLSQCTNRYKYMSILQTVRYDFQSKFQTWPVLKSESKCRITVDHHIYKEVNCRERHLFEPFSGKNSGAMTTVIQDLVLLRELNKTDSEVMESQPKAWTVIQKRSNLLHHHVPYVGDNTAGLKPARDVLKLLCMVKDTTADSHPTNVDAKMDSSSTVGLWGRLVRSARPLDYPALAQLLARAPTICEAASKHILDALPYIASPGSVELIKDMIMKDSVYKDTRHEWLMSMAMIPRPKKQMLDSMLELLRQQKNDKVISFTVSSMVHSYCKHSGKSLRECCEEETPMAIMEEFQSIVKEIASKEVIKSREDRNNIIIATKALGNIGGFKQEFADILMDIIGYSYVPVPVRLAAVDAFRRTPCVETREYFLETFRADYMNIEVRLASYLQVMKCPDLGTLRKIFHTLRHESVNQATTFVWSHLKNLGESSLPSRVEIQGLLTGNQIPHLDDSPDFRMYSRNYEQSIFFDQYNAGGNYEANVIFSPDSYIPRSMSVNLTVDMFGESINVFEMKARVEGFERYFESFFGDNGPLNKNKWAETINNLRVLRNTNEADQVRENIDNLEYKNEALKHRFPMAELGIKVFGNEISYWNAEGDDEILKSLARLNPQIRVLEILSGKEISYNKASLFLDTTFSVPTGCGLPMNMNLMGTSYVNTKMSGTVNDKYTQSGNLDFEGKLRPSVAVNIAATMSVDAGGLSASGIRVNWRLYTATAVEAKLKVRGLAAVRLDLSLPTDKQEIFAAKSELIILHGDKEKQQQGLNKNRIEQNTCSWSTFDKAIGIKVCASYQFPNMTNLRNAPYFLMSGPAKYILSLEKADPTADTYAFQYKWDKNATDNVVSFSFDTPDSKEKRMINAVIALSNTTSSASLVLQSEKSTLIAKAMYRNMPYDKSLSASLDVDGRKQFDTVMSIKRHDIKYGFVWIPHAYWVVDNERVAELSGVIKVKSKGSVTQSDIEAEFQTKQLASHLTGYYTLNGPTHGIKLHFDYQFFKSPKQTIKIEGVYSEKAGGYRHDLYGDLSMQFTAYPGYNFYAILRNIKTQSHMDIGFNVSASRETKLDPAFAFGFSRAERLSGIKLDTRLTLYRPRLVDMRFQFEGIGPKYTALALLNFNPKSREILVSGYLYFPPGTQLYLDAELNMTLPTLHPCVIKTKVHEKQPNEFQVNAFGVWFTGVDFNIDALYQDQSKTNMASHRLKALISSSHFKNIAMDARFTQDNRQITFIGQGEYNEDKYRTLIRYILLSEQNFTTYVEVDISGKAYSVNLNADLSNNTNLNMDIHFDQLRDLHFSYQRWAKAQQKRLSAAFNWDANRDPSQKVSIDVQLDNKGTWHHAGHVSLYYPGRMLTGDGEFLLKDWFCQWHVRMGWSSAANILWRVKMFSEAHNETVYALLSSLNTPFAGWKDTSFNVMWRYHDNLQALNGSMNWQEDHLAFSLLADYLFKTNEFYGEINAVVNSTIPTLPKASAIAKHRHVWKKSADTLLSFQYNEDGLLMINSSWLLDRGQKENNITGRVTLLTPFPGYRKGFLRTHFILGHKRDINGITYLDLEEKVFKIYVNGHMRRITNCMLVVNVTSPMIEFPQMTARFGFVETDRHLVAMVVTANSTTGIEVLLKLLSLQDFHVFGHVALPIQYLNRAMITAKRATEEVDFRVGWGNMDFGFTGIWHYHSPINFVYLYKLYTPLEGFEENGLVLKNLYGNGLDTELSMRLSTHKFGIAILLKDNGKGLLDVINEMYTHQSKAPADMILDNFDTRAKVVLDTLYYPTITFDAHLMKFVGPDTEDILEVNATLLLPNKPPIVLTDVFILEEYALFRNTLNLVTPFQAVKELKSVYTVDIVMGEKINVTCLVLLYNGTYWHEISYKLYYEYECGEDDTYQSYVASVGIATPLTVLPALEARVAARLEDALWKMNADISMPAFTITALASLELDDPFVETSGSLNLTSQYLEDYFIKMQFKKDFSDQENVVGGGIQIQQGDQNNYLFADVLWRPSPRHIRFKSRGALVPVLPPAELALQYTEENSQHSLTVDFNSDNNYYSLSADQTKTSVSVALSSPHKGFRAMKIIGEFDEDNIRGSFVTDSTEYSIDGKVLNREPLEMSLNLIPKGQGEPINIRVKYGSSATLYTMSAHFAGSVAATLHAVVEIQTNYTDINVKLDIPQSKYKDIYFKSRVDSYDGLRKVLSVQAATPFKRIKYVQGDTDFLFGPKTGYLLCKYELPDMQGEGDLKWSFLLGDLFIRALGHQHMKDIEKSIDLDIYFGNSTTPELMEKTDAGFKMDLDHVWQIGANASFGYILNQRLNLIINAILPKPNVDVHTLYIDANAGTAEEPAKTVEAEYRTDVTKIITGVKGNILQLAESFDSNSTITWTSDGTYMHIDNIIDYKWDVNGSHHVDYTLTSPMYIEVATLKVKGSYQKDLVHRYHIVRGVMHRPGNSQIGEIDLRYGGMKHTDGHFNFTTPFRRLPWLKSIFDINNLEELSDNKVDLFWPNKTASVNTTHRYNKLKNGFTQFGDVSLSIPLSSQHLVKTDYYYIQGEKNSNGNATIDLDGERFVKGSFNQVLSKSARNLDLAVMDIEVENVHTPVGIKYIHEFDGTGNIDVKQATVFHLRNATKFNVTGKLDVFTYDIGKDLKLTAIHGKRTWTFDNKYEAVDKELKQGSKIKWAEDVWFNYDLHVTNMTTDETESQQLIMNVWYPLRTFNLVALYNLQDTMLDGKAVLNWNVKEENKTAELRGRWENPPVTEGNLHHVDLSLAHPSFRKDVTLKGQYLSTPSVMSNISLELQYSDYENEYLKLKSILTDNSNGPVRDYRFALTCKHPSTNLDLDMKSDINIDSKWYYFNNFYRFQKSLFYEKLRSSKLLIDTAKSAITWERANETYFYKVNGTWELIYPEYKLKAFVSRPTGNDTGVATLSMLDRSLIAHYNSTDDISYHMIGQIVDTRFAKFDSWRDFDDVTTVDLASYIRLNHSRLLTSSIKWRPEIFGEVKSSAVYTLKVLYSQINETLVIIKEMPMEAHMALKAIWTDAKPRIRDFLDDLNDLHVIKDDLDEFERFLNQSYSHNDFYVKDIVEFTYYVLDEMAIRNHLESLPGIVNDMWGMMGNTSQSIKQSLTFIVDSIKKAYANFLDSVNKVLEADFMELVSERLETMIMQYDTFIRDLHMKFLEYWEETWVNATNRLSKYWHELLKSIEPLFFKVLHYTESFVFTVWKGVMDFFYNRTQELTDSPYFNYVSTFGHEMDRIYKDLMNNDLITNIKKYSKKLFDVVWSKIEKYIPFKDEFTQLYTEFKAAWQSFLQTKQVVYVREKYQEAYVRLKWWYDYFLIGEALETVGEILYAKLTDMAKTALQYEEIHRTPKTNFIFDPRTGEIILEQKLPMSWHAFNRTPDFTEISEYRAVKDFMDEWLTTNKSIWSFYYDIRPYMDFDNLIPPFAGMAMMTGQGTLVTFDKRVFTISEAGTFLLSKDYRQDNFTVLMESNDQGRYNLVILTRRSLVHIDLYREEVSIGNTVLSLPAFVDGLVVDRQTDKLTVQGNNGLEIQCNLLFHTCKLQVSGWYYASLGGLLGTYNNEQYDDLQLPNSTYTDSIPLLGHSWNIAPLETPTVIENKDLKNDTQCDKFFLNKVSPLNPCFAVISAQPFYRECVAGGSACALASAYRELCLHQHVPTHMPDHCHQCTTPQGDVIEEGSFHILTYIPNSTDVVLIVEAQHCNKNLRKTKNMDIFIEAFDTKLQANGLSDNRYAIVGFGGRGVYKRPRSLYVNNKVFTNSIEISQHFDNFVIDKSDLVRGNRTSRTDMFGALSFATRLPFRAAVPKTFVLLPCSKCDSNFMRLDYSTIYHNLMESSVTLHILMDGDFMLSKRRAAKYLFGVDNQLAYTNKDYEHLVGDAALRKQVKLPKEKLGLCTSLALETNGTIFAGAKLQGDRPTARRFSTVLGARAAAAAARCGAAPRCECAEGRLLCRPCADTQRLLELSFFNSEDIDELIDMAMEPPTLPSFR
ncbi:apolipoprotein lipid transfer particle [Anticarsia gemmatalis]|uniref:apolipoprotein lipid transfer particle n=1 Tax=Anticarsia gemmatalis TaxID=129554 RepID=UPI003F76ADA1